MSRVRIVLAIVLVFGAALSGAHADPTANPNHPVYDALEEWRIAGLIDSLPPFQPYPAHELEALLETVQMQGSPADRARAIEFAEEIEGEHSYRLWSDAKLFTRNDEIQPKFGVGIGANGSIADGLDYGGELGVFAIDRGAEDLIPAGERAEEDILEDNAKISVAGREIHTLFQMQTQGVWYSDELSLQAGIMRRAYGPFYGESPVLSKDAPQSANFLFEWDRERFRYSAALFSLTTPQWFRQRESTDPAENNQIDLDGDGVADYVDKPQNVPGKHLMMHALHVDLWPWLTVGLFESVAFGPRLELAYLVPFRSIFYAQGVANFADNSLLGFSLELKPGRRWRIPFTFYVDDADFNDFIRFNFADAKLKAAFGGAVQWAPRASLVRTAELSYEAVLPYMYTHAETNPYSTEPNYRNYLHQGQNLGPGLRPNSDRLTLSTELALTPRISIGAEGAFLRHANASEGVLEQYLNDGGFADAGKSGEFVDIDNDGAVEWIPGDLTYNDGTRFMTQDHIQHTYQAGTELRVRLPGERFSWDLTAGYTFEFVDGEIEYRWSPEDGPGGGETVSVGDTVNHYGELTVGVRY
jgi:hypothetical protein